MPEVQGVELRTSWALQFPHVASVTIPRSKDFPARQRPEHHQSELAGQTRRKRELAFAGP
eukprot:11037357-Alexandrium_andersonii.AAC.1